MKLTFEKIYVGTMLTQFFFLLVTTLGYAFEFLPSPIRPHTGFIFKATAFNSTVLFSGYMFFHLYKKLFDPPPAKREHNYTYTLVKFINKKDPNVWSVIPIPANKEDLDWIWQEGVPIDAREVLVLKYLSAYFELIQKTPDVDKQQIQAT